MTGPWSRVEFAPGMFRLRLFDLREAAAIVAAAEAQAWGPDAGAGVLSEADAPELTLRCRNRIARGTQPLAGARAPGALLAGVRILRCGAVAHGIVRDAPPALEVVCFLNGGVEGGAVVFPELQVEMHPDPGIALVFPPDLAHRYEPASAGTLYVLRASYRVPPRGGAR